MMDGIIALALAKRFTKNYCEGLEDPIIGKNCTITSIDTTYEDHAVVTFGWYDNTGIAKTSELEIPYENMKNIAEISSEKVDYTTTVTVTLRDGTTSTFDIDDGVGIDAITSETDDDGNVEVTISYTDETKPVARFTIPRASKWFSGTAISADISANPTIYRVGDHYLNVRTYDVFAAKYDATLELLMWRKQCNIKGTIGNSAYETYCELHPGATKEEFIIAITGDGIQMEKVWKKPDIRDPATEVNKWYFYQENNRDSAATLEAIVDSGSYGIGLVVQQDCILESGQTYYWDAWLDDHYMNLTMNADYMLSAGDIITINYDLVNDKIPTAIRPENKVRINIVYSDGDKWEFPAFSTITRDETPEGEKLATVLGVTDDIKGVKANEALAETSAWKGITNFSTTVSVAPGDIAVWDGVRYVCFNQPIPVDGAAMSAYFDQGIAYFTDENQARGWLIGGKTNTVTGEVEYILIDGYGVPLEYRGYLPEGFTDISDYYQEYNLLGNYWQTIYVGQTKDDAADVTIATGASTSGSFVTTSVWNEVIAPQTVLTTESNTVKGAINELNDRLKNEGYALGDIYGIESSEVKPGIDDARDVETALKQLYSFSSNIEFRNPIGCVLPFAHTAIPTGWLVCDGSAVPRAAYRKLFSRIGTTFGEGDGSTTFNVPDLRDRFVEGTDETNFTGAQIAAGLPFPTIKSSGAHTHTWNGFYGLSTTGDKYCQSRYKLSDPTDTTCNSSGAHTHTFDEDDIYGKSETVQPASIKMVWCIYTGHSVSEDVVDLFRMIDADDDHENIAFGHKMVDETMCYGYYIDGDKTSTLKPFVTESYVDARVREQFGQLCSFNPTNGILTIHL